MPTTQPQTTKEDKRSLLLLSSNQLRALVRDNTPLRYGEMDFYPFTESSHADGCLHYLVGGRHDCFSVSVPLKPFLAAWFGVPEEDIRLKWNPYDWRYSAEIVGAFLRPDERQLLEDYLDE